MSTGLYGILTQQAIKGNIECMLYYLPVSPYRPAIDPQRRQYQNPEDILAKIGLTSGMTFIDVGCGGGFFAMPAARIVGNTGKVIGFDVNIEGLEALKELAAKEGLYHVDVAAGSAEETVLCEKCADIIFFGLVVVHLQEPVKALVNAGKMLKTGGRAVVFDWKKKLTRQGPPMEQRLSEKQVTGFIEAAGMKPISVGETGPYHYVITAEVLKCS